MSSNIDTTTELVTAIAEMQITETIVNAAKGKPIKRAKKMSLSEEIKACFDFEQFIVNTTVKFEELIKRKVEEAVSEATKNIAKIEIVTEKPKVKRATKKATTVDDTIHVTQESNKQTIEEAKDEEEAKTEEKAKPEEEAKPKRATKKVVATVVEAPNNTEENKETETKEKPKTKRVKKLVKDVNQPQENKPQENKPKERKPRTKKDKTVEVSDSDSSDSEKPTQKKVIKKTNTPVLPETPEKETEEPLEELDDESSVKTTDFIQPLSISNELEEEELSDIEE